MYLDILPGEWDIFSVFRDEQKPERDAASMPIFTTGEAKRAILGPDRAPGVVEQSTPRSVPSPFPMYTTTSASEAIRAAAEDKSKPPHWVMPVAVSLLGTVLIFSFMRR